MIVVSDASILINLAWIRHLTLLQELYTDILIPQAVFSEIVMKGRGKPGAAEVQAAGWIQTKKPQNIDLVKSLRQNLDQGEAEAIALAIEVKADLLLIDERIGRSTAQYFELNVMGLIGVLIQAKRNNLIKQIKPLLDELKEIAGFRISDPLYHLALELTGE